MFAELTLQSRLQRILPLLQSDTFLQQRGINNEIGYHIFDYAPEDEGIVREYLAKTLLPRQGPDFPFVAVHLFALLGELLASEGYAEGAIDLEQDEGPQALLEGLRDFVSAPLITQAIKERLAPEDAFVLLYGVGEAWPIVRTHELLNNMHAHIDRVPVVVFYPGRFADEQLQLFERFKDDNYYRAFALVPRSTFSEWQAPTGSNP